MMFRLPPPPQFNLPPPPMPVSDLFDAKLISQLTCSSIQQQSQQAMNHFHLILFTSACVITAILLLTITLTWFLLTRKKKISNSNNHHQLKPTATSKSMNDLSICSSRSYATVSSDHTGIYVESVDTSATTCSIDTTGGLCFECYHHHNNIIPTTPYYHILSIPDVVPN